MVSDRVTKASVNPVEREASRVLENNSYFRGRSNLIDIREQDGTLILSGRVPSYYLKQVLQTTLRDIDGVRRIDNRVDVDWPR